MKTVLLAFLLLSYYPAADAQITKTATRIIQPFVAKGCKALSLKTLMRLYQTSKLVKGTKILGKELGKMRLTALQRSSVYSWIAVTDGKIAEEEARTMFKSIGKIEGFAKTMRKITGANANVAKGHLTELRQAHHLKEIGFTLSEIGQVFKDPLKKGMTDIDLTFFRGLKKFAMEVKDYQPGAFPLDTIRKDADTLLEFCKASKCQPFFTFSVSPANFPEIIRELDKRGIKYLIGSPQDQATQIMAMTDLE